MDVTESHRKRDFKSYSIQPPAPMHVLKVVERTFVLFELSELTF